MPETQTVDEVVAAHTPRAGAAMARPVVNETVDSHGAVTVAKGAAREESMQEGGTVGRKFKPSTIALFDKLEGKDLAGKPTAQTPAPHDEGDPDDDAPNEEPTGAEGEADPDDEGLVETPAEGEEPTEDTPEEPTDETPPEVEELRATKARLEQTNKTLLSQLEEARKTPKHERSAREQALVDAEQAYVDKGTVPALRMFLATVVGAAPDSKEVSEELAGLYADLTANELNVPLDQSQQSMRKAARATLALARDKRERAEGEKKAAPVNTDEAQQIEAGARFIDNQLLTKGPNGSSIADEYPRLMKLAEHFDGMKPAELLARACLQAYKTGVRDPREAPDVTIRAIATEIEAHYKAVADAITAASATTTDTTKGAPKKTPATQPNKNQSGAKGQGAHTISQATASKAPGTAPRTKQKTTTGEKTRKDFKSDAAWRQYLFDKHGLNH